MRRLGEGGLLRPRIIPAFLCYLIKCNVEGRGYKVYGYKGKRGSGQHPLRGRGASYVRILESSACVAEVCSLGGAGPRGALRLRRVKLNVRVPLAGLGLFTLGLHFGQVLDVLEHVAIGVSQFRLLFV